MHTRPPIWLPILLFAVAVFAVTAWAQQQQQPPSGGTFEVDVKLVNVFTSVTDEHGTPVGGLTKADFTILEDDTPQTIAVFDRESGMPLSFVLAMDTSLSTRKDLKLEVAAARQFVHAMLRPQDSLSLFTFSQYVDQLVGFTNRLQRIDRGLDRVHEGDGTALYDAIVLASQALAGRKGRKVLVVITDGGDTLSQTDYATALRTAQQADAMVFSIIVVPIEASAGRNTGGEHALIQISTDTGGRYYYASSTSSLDQAFARISDELRTQYLLAYYPTRRLADSSFRQIDVKVREPRGAHYQVRHRSGYFTSSAR